MKRCVKSAIALTLVAGMNQVVIADDVLPRPEPQFKGKIGETYKDSKPDFPKEVSAPKGAPNVVVIVIDDLGFGQAGTFGGPVPTPNLDKLSKQGLNYNCFHTTALSSPTRAALLTGRNHHQVSSGVIVEISTGYPGYNSMWGSDCAAIPEVLKYNGYNTAAFGKWHNTPDWETSTSGPFTRWPTGVGFDYFYGFLGGETSQYDPQLFLNTQPVEPERTPEEGYHLTTDIADKAIAWMRLHQSITPEKPYLLYFAPGAVHAPHHVPKEWIDKFKGQFDQGWDKLREETFERQKKLGVIPAETLLTPRPNGIPSWEGLTDDQKRLYAREQEVFAGFLAHLDHEIGRLLDAIAASPQAGNTLIICILGDNGPSPEGGLTGTLNNMATQNGFPDDVATMLKHIDEIGGPKHENHYSIGWAWAGSAPFQWMKQVASHFGGTRNPMIVVWPDRIKDKGGLRGQFHHVIDIAPTIYDAIGIKAPKVVDGTKQKPIEGISMIYTFDDPDLPSKRTTQYFELSGNRAIYHDGWIACARHGLPWILIGRKGDFGNDKWELYNIKNDFSEAVDLSKKYPDKLKELKSLFDKEAKRNNVYPLDDRAAERMLEYRPSITAGKTSFTYYPGAIRIPETSAPNLKMKSHRITVDVNIPDNGAEGVLVAEGGSSAGYTLFIKGDKLVYEYNFLGRAQYTITSTSSVPKGTSRLVFDYEQQGKTWGGGGIGRLSINGQPAGEGTIAMTVPGRFSGTETFDVGEDLGATVSESYKGPFKFTGEIKKVTVDILQAQAK
jgi:arylsulfatase